MAFRLYMAVLALACVLVGAGVAFWIGIERAEAAEALAVQARMQEHMAREAALQAPQTTSPDTETPERSPVGPSSAESTVPADLTARITLLNTLLDELLVLAEDPEAGEPAQVAREALTDAIGRIMRRDNERRAEVRKLQREEYAATVDARQLAQGWVGDANQLTDVALRDQTLEEIRTALFSEDEERRLAAVIALSQLGDLEFDRTGLRDPLVEIAGQAEGSLLVSALYALASVERRPEDLELALRVANDPSASSGASALHLLAVYADGDLTGEAGHAAMKLLAERGDEAHLNGLWGTRVSDEIAAWLIRRSESVDHEVRHDAVYFGLSTLREKSPEVVAKLVEFVLGADDSNAGRALWGLGHGVPEESWPTVCVALRTVFEGRSDERDRRSALHTLGTYGSAEDAQWLAGHAEDPSLSESLRDAIQDAIAAIEAR